jgi:hypothetical protein
MALVRVSGIKYGAYFLCNSPFLSLFYGATVWLSMGKAA